ncbi:hypothetical protein [Pseudomonas sp. UBA2684]|uniref:hypothetical protein n=1 Tax=Pseudomonas sp. UBA2684 TaxID=1947311 RepID=UPI0025D22DCE|nr:hypothetical protein [Pseudomonas sp. UBA2684]
MPTPVYITAAVGFLLGIQFGPSIAAMNTVFMGLVAWAICGFRLTSPEAKPANIENNSPTLTAAHPGVFIIKAANDASMSTTEYGQAVIGWACQAFPSSMGAILESPDQSLIMKKIRENPFPLELQLIALHSSIYWVYALSVSKAPESIVTELNRGLEVGLSKLHDPQGAPFDTSLKELYMISFKAYFSAQTKVFNDHEGDYPDLVSQSFFHILSQVYKVNPGQIETITRFHLGHIIDDLTPTHLIILKNELGISFG